MVNIVHKHRSLTKIKLEDTKVDHYYLIQEPDLAPCLVYRKAHGLIEINEEDEMTYTYLGSCREDAIYLPVSVTITAEIEQ